MELLSNYSVEQLFQLIIEVLQHFAILARMISSIRYVVQLHQLISVFDIFRAQAQ